MQTWLLGIIALSTAVMAAGQVAAAIYAARGAKTAMKVAEDLQRDLKPILARTQQVVDDAARVSALTVTQVERVDAFVTHLTSQVQEISTTIHAVVSGPVRHGAAVFNTLRSVLEMFQSRAAGSRQAGSDDDPTFVG